MIAVFYTLMEVVEIKSAIVDARFFLPKIVTLFTHSHYYIYLLQNKKFWFAIYHAFIVLLTFMCQLFNFSWKYIFSHQMKVIISYIFT